MTALWILLAHLTGDYVLQSSWMAVGKLQRWLPAVAHGVAYTLPHALITQSPWALLVIGGTHILFDRYDMACRMVWLRNHLAPRREWQPWAEVRGNYGAPADCPRGTALGIKIVVDNCTHLAINGAAIALMG
jgi:hypothetical protein